MQITSEQLRQISIFGELNPEQLLQLYPHTMVQYYSQGEIILHEGDSRSGRLRQRLPPKLFAVFSGVIQIKKTASTGKETILRTLPAGEIFAAPALFGDGISPATVVANRDCEILMIARSALLDLIQQTPDVAFQMLALLNDRIQKLHSVVHGLVSERAIVRLAQYIQLSISESSVETTPEGTYLRSRLSYYQIARSIGITYEECVLLFKENSVVTPA
jgi:CRP/FNR family transcriptional regulator, cyclic AMP receptor protein